MSRPLRAELLSLAARWERISKWQRGAQVYAWSADEVRTIVDHSPNDNTLMGDVAGSLLSLVTVPPGAKLDLLDLLRQHVSRLGDS